MNTKICVACAEEIKLDAKLCRFCQTLQNDSRFAEARDQEEVEDDVHPEEGGTWGWACTHCGSKNRPGRTVCWNCHQSSEAISTYTLDEPINLERDPYSPASATSQPAIKIAPDSQTDMNPWRATLIAFALIAIFAVVTLVASGTLKKIIDANVGTEPSVKTSSPPTDKDLLNHITTKNLICLPYQSSGWVTVYNHNNQPIWATVTVSWLHKNGIVAATGYSDTLLPAKAGVRVKVEQPADSFFTWARCRVDVMMAGE